MKKTFTMLGTLLLLGGGMSNLQAANELGSIAGQATYAGEPSENADNEDFIYDLNPSSIMPDPQYAKRVGDFPSFTMYFTPTAGKGIEMVNPDATLYVEVSGQKYPVTLTYYTSRGVKEGLVVNFTEEFNALALAGIYSITIPKGFLQAVEGNQMNPDFTINYTVNNIVDYVSINPAPGSYSARDLSNVRVRYPGAVSLTGVNPYVYDKDDEEYQLANISASGNELVLDLSNLADGKYTLYVPQAAVTVGNQYTTNRVFEVSYTVSGGIGQGIIVNGPAENNTLNMLEPLQLTWDVNVTLNPEVGVILTNGVDYGSGYAWEDELPASALTLIGQTLKIDFTNYLPNLSDYYSQIYNIIIPEGLVTGNGSDNVEQTITFNIYQLCPAEAELVKKDEYHYQVNWITTGGYVAICSLNEDYPVTPYLTDGTSTITLSIGMELSFEPLAENMTVYKQLAIDLSNVQLGNKEWTLVIPEGFMLIELGNDTYLNGALSFDNDYLTEVKALESENSFKVFNLQGINVLNTQDVNAVKKLDAGIYIVNGKKIVIK